MNRKIVTLALISLIDLPAHSVERDLNPQRVGSWPGFLRGHVTEVVAVGNYLYLAARILHVMDVSDPAHPERVTGLDLGSHVIELAVKGSFAYVATESGLHVLDVGNPGTPRRVGRWGSTPIRRVKVSESHVLLWEDGSSLQVIDVADPARPQRVGGKGAQGWFLNAAAASGQFAYVAESSNGARARYRFQVIDVSDPAAPRQAGICHLNEHVREIACLDAHVYLASEKGLVIIDASNPALPVVSGEIAIGSLHGLAIAGRYACVTGDDGRVSILDLLVPSSPRTAGTFATEGGAIAMSENRVAVASEGVEIVEITNPAHPKSLGYYQIYGDTHDVVVSGDHAFLADGAGGLKIVDVSRPSEPRVIGGLRMADLATHVAVSGRRVLLAERRWGEEGQELGRVNIIDVENPEEPIWLSAVDTTGGITGLLLRGEHVLVASSSWSADSSYQSTLEMVDVGTPGEPVRVGQRNMAGRIEDMALSEPYVYVLRTTGSDERSTLERFDLRDSVNLPPAGGHEFATTVIGRGVAVSGSLAFIAQAGWENSAAPWTGGLTILDISNPQEFRRIATYGTSDSARQVAIQGEKVCLVEGWGAFQIIDVSQPDAPRRVGHYAMTGFIGRLRADGRYAWIASHFQSAGTWYYSEGEGMVVIDVEQPARLTRVSSLPRAGRGGVVAASGTEAWSASFADGLQVIDMGDRENPAIIGAREITTEVVDLVFSSPYGYLLHNRHAWPGTIGQLEIVGFEDPARPQILGRHETTEAATALEVSNGHAYIAEAWYRGNRANGRLSIIDVNEPSSPVFTGSYEAPGVWLWDVAVSGRHAYLASGTVGLVVVDVEDPANPIRVGAYEPEGEFRAVIVHGSHACAVGTRPWTGATPFNLTLLDIRDPAHPTLLAELALDSRVHDMAFRGNHLYVADGTGVEVIDVTNPARPRRAGGSRAFDAHSLAVEGESVIVSGPHGLTLLEPLIALRLAPTFTPANGQLRLSIEGPTGQPIEVQRSRDLRDWTAWRTLTLTASRAELVDPNVPDDQRFYRVMEVSELEGE